MLETLEGVSPLIATLGGGATSLVIVNILWRFYKDVLAEYRAELEQAQSRRREAEDLLEREKRSHRDCVLERESLRIALKVHGVPWEPEDW